MFVSLCILGRQAGISVAELESLYGSDNLYRIGNSAALLRLPPSEIDIKRLGGTLKVCKTLTDLPYTDWRAIHNYLVENVPKHVDYIPEGKIKFGLSVYGIDARRDAINATALSIKKAVKAAGRSVRVIPNTTPTLNSAQVLRNKLTDALGMELIVVRDGNKTWLAQTTSVQDIDAYAARDQQRPKRDARVGMLPPKLAQIIINLSGVQQFGTLWDPFCGTGVLLQEALLMGIDVYGSDLEPRMIEYSQANLEWLKTHKPVSHGGDLSMWYSLTVADATTVMLTSQHTQPIQAIAAETYLGRPFSTEPNPDKLREVISDVNTIHKKFLQNVARQTRPGFRMCIAVPAWYTKNGIKHLPVLDHLTDMGYTRLSFVHATDSELIYHREDQIVGRELVTLIRK